MKQVEFEGQILFTFSNKEMIDAGMVDETTGLMTDEFRNDLENFSGSCGYNGRIVISEARGALAFKLKYGLTNELKPFEQEEVVDDMIMQEYDDRYYR